MLGLNADTLEQALKHVEANGCIYRDPATREILAAYPFSTQPTDHRVRFPDGPWVYSMCAIDALGMPAMLITHAIIESRCAQCGQAICIVVRDNVLAEYAPPDARVWSPQADVHYVAGLDLCPAINFFCSTGHLSAWRAEHTIGPGKEYDLPHAFERGRAVFGSLLRQTS